MAGIISALDQSHRFLKNDGILSHSYNNAELLILKHAIVGYIILIPQFSEIFFYECFFLGSAKIHYYDNSN